MAPVKGLWTCMMCHFCSTVLFPVMELYLFDWMFKCTFTFLHKHNFNHLYSVYRKMVLATLLQRCWPFSGRSSIIIFIAMCLERMNFQEHHLCIFQALGSQLVLYLHLHSVFNAMNTSPSDPTPYIVLYVFSDMIWLNTSIVFWRFLI